MITSGEVNRLAKDSGFRPEVVEKVLRLQGILRRLDDHAVTRDQWVLKGGTALNLLHLDVPRLSVDIDVNYIGSAGLEEMRRSRPEFERTLAACCQREGCSVHRTPNEHAGGKFRLRFASVLGGSQNLEVDVSFVARVPLLGLERKAMRFPPESGLTVPVLTLEELAAEKFTALLQRSVPRDSFDAAKLLELVPDLQTRPGFRLAFICSLGAARTDIRLQASSSTPLEERMVAQELEPMLRRTKESDPLARINLIQWMTGKLEGVREGLLTWSAEERRFLDLLLDQGEIRPEHLHSDPAIQQRILQQPMLNWKAKNVRNRRGGDESWP